MGVADASPGDAIASDAPIPDGDTSDVPADAAPPDPPPDPPVPLASTVLYPEGRRHSPLTPALVERLQAIAAAAPHQDRVFAKVGDSITVAAAFLHCFDGGTVELGENSALADTRSYHLAGTAAGSSPFARWSLSAVSGATTRDALNGSPNRIESELAAIDARVAVVMLGTNDARFARTVDDFGADLWTIVDLLVMRGVVPILSTVPANLVDPGVNPRITTFNRVIRAIAQGRGVPLVDLHAQLAPLPNRGLSDDGLHPSVAPGGACLLTSEGLSYGYNVRNLLSLEALDRVRQALAGLAADPAASTRSGTGLASDPVRATLPLLDLADTRAGAAAIGGYGCGGRAQPGREIVYQLDLPTQVTIDAYVVDRGATDVDVHVLAGSLDPAACVASADRVATATVGPGLGYVVVDTPATEGEFVLVVSAR
jgi:lysophospholipase L1-like esterase